MVAKNIQKVYAVSLKLNLQSRFRMQSNVSHFEADVHVIWKAWWRVFDLHLLEYEVGRGHLACFQMQRGARQIQVT